MLLLVVSGGCSKAPAVGEQYQPGEGGAVLKGHRRDVHCSWEALATWGTVRSSFLRGQSLTQVSGLFHGAVLSGKAWRILYPGACTVPQSHWDPESKVVWVSGMQGQWTWGWSGMGVGLVRLAKDFLCLKKHKKEVVFTTSGYWPGDIISVFGILIQEARSLQVVEQKCDLNWT